MTIKSLSGFRRLGLVRLGLVLVAMFAVAALPAATLGENPRAKKAFDPKTTGQVKVPYQSVVVASGFKNTWCNRSRPGLKLKTKGPSYVYFISFARLAKNYTMASKSTTITPKQKSHYLKLAKANGIKAKRFSPVYNACVNTGGSATPLRFNFSDAVGVTVGSAASRKGRPSTRQSSGGIKAVLANGALRDAIASGTATISKVAVSPSGQIVIAFSNKVNLDNASSSYSPTGCVIITVDRSTGVPTCIDESLSNLQNFGSGGLSIQFDASGGIYYVGSVCTQTCMTVFRRYKNGALTELINAQISVNSFIVADTGTVFMLGYTSATSVWFNRRYSAAGGILNLGAPASNQSASYRKYSDGNVYMYGADGLGIARFNVAADSLDTTLWIGPSATQDWTAHCAGTGSGTGPCTAGGSTTYQSSLVAGTSSGKNFQPGTNGLVQTYPTLSTFTLPISTVSVLGASGNVVLAAGTTTAGENKLVKFDSDTNTVSTLASRTSANGEIEFYHVEPSSDGYALFDGLRFSDNTYVIGKIHYSTGEVTILSTVTGKLDDFKAF